jgi:hypothetical protein
VVVGVEVDVAIPDVVEVVEPGTSEVVGVPVVVDSAVSQLLQSQHSGTTATPWSVRC